MSYLFNIASPASICSLVGNNSSGIISLPFKSFALIIISASLTNFSAFLISPNSSPNLPTFSNTPVKEASPSTASNPDTLLNTNLPSLITAVAKESACSVCNINMSGLIAPKASLVSLL